MKFLLGAFLAFNGDSNTLVSALFVLYDGSMAQL